MTDLTHYVLRPRIMNKLLGAVVLQVEDAKPWRWTIYKTLLEARDCSAMDRSTRLEAMGQLEGVRTTLSHLKASGVIADGKLLEHMLETLVLAYNVMGAADAADFGEFANRAVYWADVISGRSPT